MFAALFLTADAICATEADVCSKLAACSSVRSDRSVVAEQAGWLAGLRDPLVGKALSLLHAKPAYDWTLDELAKQAGLSRSVLAERFMQFVGIPPMQYLAKWRMQIAAELLTGSNVTLAR